MSFQKPKYFLWLAIMISGKLLRGENRKMNRKLWYSLFGGLIFALCLSGLTFGQDLTGSIVGTVKDASGAVVPGATVTVTDPNKDNIVIRIVTTSDDGTFSVPIVPVSTYSVTVEAANFKKSVLTDIKVDVGQRRPVD